MPGNRAPLASAFADGRDSLDPALTWGRSVAGGINIPDPPRAKEILAAARASGGAIVTVTEDEIADAQAQLAKSGVLVEATSAAAWAGASTVDEGSVVVLTGSGLKEPV